MSDLDEQAAAVAAPAPDEPVADRDTAGGGDGSDGGWRARLQRHGHLAVWVLLALVLAVAVVSTVQWRQLAAVEAERTEVLRSAEHFVATLTTWDAAEGMATTREQLRDAGTDRFADEVDELFGTTEDLAGLEEIAARSEGEIQRSFVQEIDGERAVALVVVDQRTTAAVLDGVQDSVRYAELELVRTPDGWRVDDVELLVDAVQQGQPAPPGAGLEGTP